jgi:hypothetical protein
MRTPHKAAAGTLAAAALAGPSHFIADQLAHDPIKLLDVSATLLAETMVMSELKSKSHSSPPRVSTSNTTTTTGAGSRPGSRRGSIVSRAGNISILGSQTGGARPLLLNGLEDPNLDKPRGSTYSSMADISSRDMVAQEEHSAAGMLVKALLDADEANNKSSVHESSHVTNAPKSLIHARFAKHTAASLSHVRERGLAVSRNAPAFVNVNSLVRMTVARGLQ